MSGSDPAAVASGSDLMTSGSDLVVVLATGHVLWFVALLSHGVEHSVHRTATWRKKRLSQSKARGLGFDSHSRQKQRAIFRWFFLPHGISGLEKMRRRHDNLQDYTSPSRFNHNFNFWLVLPSMGKHSVSVRNGKKSFLKRNLCILCLFRPKLHS